MIRCRVALLLVSLVLLGACSDSHGTTALFAAQQEGDDFYALPYPNDLRRLDDGSLDLSLFPTNSLIVDAYRMVAQTLDGFGLNSAEFVRFDAPIDPTSLPDPAASMQPGASVFLVNVDTTSKNFGLRTPIIADFRPDKTNTIGTNRLAVRPYPGFGLDEGTTYALVITNRVLAMDGSPVEAASDFKATLGTGGSDKIVRARTTYKPLLDWLAATGNEPSANVIDAAVFTTQHATFVAPALRAGVYGTPAPVGADIILATPSTQFTLWTGTYTAPNFQTGDPPYLNGGGEVQVGGDGVAIVQRIEPMRFAMSIPNGPTPATGWPICIYQHGTGGDWEDFFNDGTADRMAGEGIAVISTDQVLHGPRDPSGTDPGVAFFDFGNPLAGRDNALQGFADAWSQLRLALGLSVVDAANSRTITFDPARVYFFGHSQGGLTGPGFVAFEPLLKGAVFSGTGGLLYLGMLYKLLPIDFPPLVETLTRDSPMDEDNPSIALAQMWIERADGANYARFMVRDPQLAPDGVTPLAPRNIFQTEGFIDTYAPNVGIEAFATAIGGNEVVLPAEKDVLGLTLRGNAPMATPFSNNVNGVTAVLAQYTQQPGDDGHFVVFDIQSAKTQSSEFLGTLSRTGTATIVTPP